MHYKGGASWRSQFDRRLSFMRSWVRIRRSLRQCSPKGGVLDCTHEASGIGQADSNKNNHALDKVPLEDTSINVDLRHAHQIIIMRMSLKSTFNGSILEWDFLQRMVVFVGICLLIAGIAGFMCAIQPPSFGEH